MIIEVADAPRRSAIGEAVPDGEMILEGPGAPTLHTSAGDAWARQRRGNRQKRSPTKNG